MENKPKKKSIFRRLKEYFFKSGMFSKILVIFCIAYCVRIIEWAIAHYESWNTEASTIITAGLALFGGELLLLCIKRVFSKSDVNKTDSSDKKSSSGSAKNSNDACG